jgi:U3 small nucleolar RNA-associated protein 14
MFNWIQKLFSSESSHPPESESESEDEDKRRNKDSGTSSDGGVSILLVFGSNKTKDASSPFDGESAGADGGSDGGGGGGDGG